MNNDQATAGTADVRPSSFRRCCSVSLRSPIVCAVALIVVELAFRHAADESGMGSKLLSPAGSTGPVVLAATLLITRLFVVWILPGVVAGWLLLRAWEAMDRGRSHC